MWPESAALLWDVQNAATRTESFVAGLAGSGRQPAARYSTFAVGAVNVPERYQSE